MDKSRIDESKAKDKALGMIEHKTVPTGMYAADMITKAAEVEILEASVVCPGKYLVIFSGELSSVKIAVDLVKSNCGGGLIGHFVIGNPHQSIFGAIRAEIEKENIEALGIIETKTAAAAILAGDSAAKSAIVKLIEIRLAKGMCGKSYVLFSGSIANVEEAVEISCKAIGGHDAVIDSAVIPRPTEKFWQAL